MAGYPKIVRDAPEILRLVRSMISMGPAVLGKDATPVSVQVRNLSKFVRMYFGEHLPVYGSADITNTCNLKCKHCYWWKNRRQSDGLDAAQWSKIIDDVFLKKGLLNVALTGGEPMTRPDVIKLFSKKMPGRFSIVTNGTLGLKKIKGLSTYYVSIDGTEKIHNRIRGLDIYSKVKRNVQDYGGPVTVNMTLNSVNTGCIEQVADEWHGVAKYMNFQFHTPFDRKDPLWIPFGPKRDAAITTIRRMKGKYPDFFLNTDKQLENLRSGAWTKTCPAWAFISLDSSGNVKEPCCIGGGEKKPICSRCGICETSGFHAGIYQFDAEWIDIYNSFFRSK